MKRLNEEVLHIGDIILKTTTATVSKSIRIATRSDISHAMIYVQDHSVIEATAEGVQARNTQRILFDDDCSVYVLGLKDGLSATDAQIICNFVRAKVGTQYSTKEAVRTIVGGGRDWTKKQFCSRLVAQAYASVGISLVNDPNYCSPANLKDSSLLFNVNPATVPITVNEASYWENVPDKTQLMRDTINAVLDGARRKNTDIQSCNDLDAHLIRCPEDDDYMSSILEQSGYLTLWQIEKEANPWQYDLDLMNSISVSDGIAKYCHSVLSNEVVCPNRYIFNRGGYAAMSKQFGLRFFELMQQLYDILASLHRTRVEVATKIAASQKYAPCVVDDCIPPTHTTEWFDALAIWNPVQAAMTKPVVATAGHANVCSICGDEPVGDYGLRESYRPPTGLDTLRLCEDCLKIRLEMGDPFDPLDHNSLDATQTLP